MPKSRRRAIVLTAILLSAGACSATGSAPPAGTTAPTSVSAASTVIPPPGTYTTLAPGPGTASNAAPPSPETQHVIDITREALGLKDAEADCLARRVEADGELKAAVVSAINPQASTRWQQFTDLAADCIRTTTSATNFANSIQAQANGALSTDTLNCLRDGYAKLTADDAAALVRSALNPGSIDPNVKQKYDEIFIGCGVDQASLDGAPS